MLIGLMLGLGIATWTVSHIAFHVDAYIVGFYIHLEQ